MIVEINEEILSIQRIFRQNNMNHVLSSNRNNSHKRQKKQYLIDPGGNFFPNKLIDPNQFQKFDK